MEPNFFVITILSLPFLLIAGISKASDSPAVHVNRLAKEKSPYLLQHSHNPVDWYPWGKEALEKSKKEDKPILLSIGYSTCHWCHVMEKESFENQKTAQIMNQNYVSIKVDREERPDIDHVYMDYVMATTGSGGWPMTVFLTPDMKPFYGGTYFPPEDRYGIPGFKTLLLSIADAWKTRRDEIAKSADSAVSYLETRKGRGSSNDKKLSKETLYTFFERHKSSFDTEWGGFGGAPKFPRSHSLSMLLRYWLRSGNPEALNMTEKTLNKMADGGMYDQIGGGFHRYSTDAQWRVPHFEKMLYDQALLSRTYLEAYQVTHKERYADIAKDILDYVLREMTSKDGAFYSAQDADSIDPFNPSNKREGAFFVWKESEIDAALSKNDAEVVKYFYGIETKGNALSDPHHEFTDQNVLFKSHSAEETAAHFKISVSEVDRIIGAAGQKLSALRSKRPAPHLDDKILADWNGLMISSFAMAADVFDEPRYRNAAVKAADFIQTKMKKDNSELYHRYRDGEAAISANLNDYAFMVYAYLSLYETTFDERWLKEAKNTAEIMIRLFWDEKDGGFFLTASNAEKLITRPKELYDGAVPSGNSFAVLDLILLGCYMPESRFQKYAEQTLDTFSEEISSEPTAYPQMLIALDFMLGPSKEIVIAGDSKDPLTVSMLKEIHLRFMPNKIIMLHKPGAEGKSLEELVPFSKEQTALQGRTTAYVCQNYACALPVTDLDGLKKQLMDTKGS